MSKLRKLASYTKEFKLEAVKLAQKSQLLINVYPSELLSIGSFRPGFTFGYQNSYPFFGITTGLIPIGVYFTK